jgi:hypothetical protein
MTWVGNKWDCELCDQLVDGVGPWCKLYSTWKTPCQPEVKVWLNDADAQGDGPLVNALCQYGRAAWGQDLDW